MKKEEVKEEKKATSKKKTSTAKKQTGQTATKKATSKKENTKSATEKKETVKKNAVKESKKVEEVLEEETIEEEFLEEEEIDEEIDTITVDPSTKKRGIQKSDIALVIGLVVVVLLGCLVMKGKKVEPNYTLPLTLSGEAGLQQLSYAEYQEKIDNNESFVVIVERKTCSHCVSFMPVAEEFAKSNGVPMYYVDTDTFTSEEWETFESSNTYLKKNSGKWGTPTTIVLAGKEAVDSIVGEATADSLLELYNKYFDMNK